MIEETVVEKSNAFKSMAWQLNPKPESAVADEQLNLALLVDIRSYLRSIRTMLVFFTVVAVIGIVLSIIQAVILGGK